MLRSFFVGWRPVSKVIIHSVVQIIKKLNNNYMEKLLSCGFVGIYSLLRIFGIYFHFRFRYYCLVFLSVTIVHPLTFAIFLCSVRGLSLRSKSSNGCLAAECTYPIDCSVVEVGFSNNVLDQMELFHYSQKNAANWKMFLFFLIMYKLRSFNIMNYVLFYWECK